MKINGVEIAEEIYTVLKKRVELLKIKQITPHLTVILIGDNPASVAYVLQKQKKGEYVGAKVTLLKYDINVTNEELKKTINELNHDSSVHGILLQRPVPAHIDTKTLDTIIDPKKDLDGFHSDSTYTLPLPLSVVAILENIYYHLHPKDEKGILKDILSFENNEAFLAWIRTKTIVLLGKGETGGKPIKNYFQKLDIPFILIDSKTQNSSEVLQTADIIISAVGKERVIKPDQIRKEVILISVGLFRGKDGKLHGDYEEGEIQDISSFYTPTPGGVGPVNVAMLLENLVTATENTQN